MTPREMDRFPDGPEKRHYGKSQPWWEAGVPPEPMWPAGSESSARRTRLAVLAGIVLGLCALAAFFVWIGVYVVSAG